MSADRDPALHLTPSSSDAELLAAHEHVLVEKSDDGGNYKLLPLALLFLFSGMIFVGGTYLNRFSGEFDALVYNELGGPPKAEAPTINPYDAGRALYLAQCMACHQQTGTGLPGIYPPLAGSEWVTGSEERLIRIVLHGLTGPITVAGTEYPGAIPMPAFGPTGAGLSDERIAYILTYVRQSWGNEASAIDPAKVTEIRTQVGAHGPWTAAELEQLP